MVLFGPWVDYSVDTLEAEAANLHLFINLENDELINRVQGLFETLLKERRLARRKSQIESGNLLSDLSTRVSAAA